MMNFINTVIGIPLGYLMWICYQIVKNYGIAIIVFTVFTKLIMFPISISVQKNSIKMIKLQPELNEIAAQYAGDRDKTAEEQMQLYKRERYSPLAGMIPMLIQIPIILGLIAVVYNPLQHLLHLDPRVISAFVEKATELAGAGSLGSLGQLKAIEMIRDPNLVPVFLNIRLAEADISAAISEIQAMRLQLFGLNLAQTPSFTKMDVYALIPLLSGLSALLLSIVQNKENVLQREQSFLGKWGVAIFLVLFSAYFSFIVPIGIGLYWIASNLLSIPAIYILNGIYPPKKHIDYKALEASKKHLEESRRVQQQLKPTPEQKRKSKADYARFLRDDNIKQLVYYSEKSGFYKYFKDQIETILARSDLSIHYITSDPNDAVFSLDNPRLIPYYIDDNRLIPLFMQIDADVVVMTTLNLQTFHLKRSLVRKDIQYIYTPHDCISTHMAALKGAYDHFDTIFCSGQHNIDEIRETERLFGLPAKKLVPCGYALMDNLIRDYDAIAQMDRPRKQILIAPSWHKDNLLETCIDDMLTRLLQTEYDIIVRPHPEYIKRFPAKVQALATKYESEISRLRFETDFTSHTSVFASDLLITDWSGVAFEFSYPSKKPSLFINTPAKALNPDFDKYTCIPVEKSLRNVIGISIDPGEIGRLNQAISDLFANQEQYRAQITETMRTHLFHQGHSKEVAADYIIGAIKDKAAPT